MIFPTHNSGEPNFHNELRRIVSRVEGDWVSTREQISLRVNGLSDTEWEGLTNAIGLTPARLAPLSNVVEVQDTPLFFLNSEQVFCVHGGACFDAIFAFFDQIARSDPALRDRYGLRIASWMEEEVEHLMGSISRRKYHAERLLC